MCIRGHKSVKCPVFGKKASRAMHQRSFGLRFFSRPRFRKYFQKRFSRPLPKNTDTVQTNLVAFEFEVRCYVNTLRILESLCPNVWSGGKVSRTWLPVFSVSFCFSLKTCNFSIMLPLWFKLQTSDFRCYARTVRARKQSCSNFSICSALKKIKNQNLFE
jgi:hypothetical protein